MMRRRSGLAVVWACLMTIGLVHAGEPESPHRETVYSPNAFKVPYLGLDGTFTLDPEERSATDPRNPPRVVFRQMEYFAFYADRAGAKPHAEACRYVYQGAAGDPYYYPTRAKTSVWDLFELASGAEACKAFSYVAVRAPHGKPMHMHLRYGDEHSSFRQLLQLSTGPEDKTQWDPWWSVYCAEGVSGCDK
jgi:hypothetical protein